MKIKFVLSMLVILFLHTPLIAQTTQPSSVDKTKTDGPALQQIYLEDGSRIVGELSTNTIIIVTEFGELEVPLRDVISIRPGIHSRNELRKHVDKLIENLSSVQFDARDKAEKELAQMGVRIKVLIEGHMKSETLSTEARTRLENILHEINKEIKLQDEFMEDVTSVLPLEDQVETSNFTIAGKIVQQAYQFKTKYGVLSLNLGDVEVIKQYRHGRPALKRLLIVSSKHIHGSGKLSTNIKVKKGDVINIKASGKLTLPPWGNQAFSTPAGNPSFGGFINIEGTNVGNGGLLIKLNDKVLALDENNQFIVQEDAVLEFAIAIHTSYINGYNYSGEYQVRLRIEPRE